MQTERTPLAFLGVKRFDYTPKETLDIFYDPFLQISNMLWLTECGRDTVSDVSTDSGLFQNYDDEERDQDD